MARASSHPFSCFIELGIRVANAHAHAALRGFRNHFQRSVEFRSNCHYANVAARGLPKFVECCQSWFLQVFWRMHAATRMTEERSFNVDPQRLRPSVVIFLRRLNRVRQTLEGTQSLVHWRGHGGGEITGHAVAHEKTFHPAVSLSIRLHQVIPRGPMRMHIEKPGREDAVPEVSDSALGRGFGSTLRA